MCFSLRPPSSRRVHTCQRQRRPPPKSGFQNTSRSRILLADDTLFRRLHPYVGGFGGSGACGSTQQRRCRGGIHRQGYRTCGSRRHGTGSGIPSAVATPRHADVRENDCHQARLLLQTTSATSSCRHLLRITMFTNSPWSNVTAVGAILLTLCPTRRLQHPQIPSHKHHHNTKLQHYPTTKRAGELTICRDIVCI